MQLIVVKRDKSIEKFETAKLAKVMNAAGVDATKAQELACVVEKYFEDTNKEKITSLQIRDKVLECLREHDQYAANLFEWYQKTKEH